jgi:hypothetical protein
VLRCVQEGKRRGGSGGGHKEFGSGTSEDEDDDEDDGSDTESESEAPQSRKSARGGGAETLEESFPFFGYVWKDKKNDHYFRDSPYCVRIRCLAFSLESSLLWWYLRYMGSRWW